MVPEVKKAASSLLGKGVKVAAVNSDNEPGLAQSLGIRGFPCVRWVGGGKMTEFKGQRQSQELIAFGLQQAAITAVKAYCDRFNELAASAHDVVEAEELAAAVNASACGGGTCCPNVLDGSSVVQGHEAVSALSAELLS